jgi:hypothetical protein
VLPNHWAANLVYWETSEPDGAKGTNLIPIYNPSFPELDAGLPVLDIAPNSNTDHRGAVVYVQQIIANNPGTPENEARFRVHEIDNFLGIQRTVIIQNPVDPLLSSFYPSVSIHYNDSSNDDRASISYFENILTANRIRRSAGFLSRIYYPPERGIPITPKVVGVNLDILVGDPTRVTAYITIPKVVMGTWQPIDILQISPGLSSAIVTESDGMYWAGFCESVDFEVSPHMTWAAYGNVDF